MAAPNTLTQKSVEQQALHIKTITDYQEFLSLEQDWNTLLSTSGEQPLPLTHQWINTWWKNFAEDRQLNICCFYHDSKLVAIAPLMREFSSYRGIKSSFLTLMVNGHSPYSDIIFDNTISPEQRSQVLESLIKNNKQDVLAFAKISKTGDLYAELTRHPKIMGYKYGSTDQVTTPILPISNDWDTFFKSKSRKFRKGINNKINKFEKLEHVHISREKIENAQNPVLDEIVEISKKSWKTTINNDLGTNTAGKNFLLGLADTFGLTNQVYVWIARRGNTPIAFEFHIIHDSIAYPLRADFDEDHRDISPGSVLEFSAIKSLFEDQNVSQYYSCADEYLYLSKWTQETKKHADIEVFNKTLKASLLHTLEYRLIPAFRALRSKLQGDSPRPRYKTLKG